MEKLQSSFKNMLIVLLAITGIAAAALGSVYEATKAPIAAAQALKQEQAIKSVVPDFDNDPIAEVQEYDVDGGIVKIFPAKKGDKEVGYAIETFTNNGFSGLIRLMVGIDPEGNIINFSVLEHKETPGLGSKMQEWFSTKGDIRGLNADKDKLSVRKDGGDVDAITAATISSRAFLDAINRGIKTQKNNASDAHTGATSIKKDISAKEALTLLCPNKDNDPIAEMEEQDGVKIYPIKKDGKQTAIAYESFSNKGYGGEIKLMIITDMEGIIKTFYVMKHNETEGLGSKMEQWFTEESSIIGLNIKEVQLRSRGGSVDGITSATITSTAFMDAIEKIKSL